MNKIRKIGVLTYFFLLLPSAYSANIVYNATGTVQGFGDVVGVIGNLTGMKKYFNNEDVFLIVDDRATEVIESAYEKPLDSFAKDLGIKIIDIRNVRNMPKADTAIESFFGGRFIDDFTDVVFHKPDTITLISDTMHGDSYDEIRGPKATLFFKPPGIGVERSGILHDPYLKYYLPLSKQSVKNKLIRAFNGDINLQKLFSSHEFKDILFGFFYGAHNERFGPQLIGQTKEFISQVEKTQSKPVVLFTPNKKEDLSFVFPDIKVYTLQELLILLGDKKQIENKVYIVSLGTVTAKQFTGLIALSDLPVFIEGNNAIGAAIRLAKPFIVYRSLWNGPMIKDLISVEKRYLNKNIFKSVYGDPDTNFKPHLHFFVANLPGSEYYESLNRSIQSLPNKLSAVLKIYNDFIKIIEITNDAERENELIKLVNKALKELRDEVLAYSILYEAHKQSKLSEKKFDIEKQKIGAPNLDAMEKKFIPNKVNSSLKLGILNDSRSRHIGETIERNMRN